MKPLPAILMTLPILLSAAHADAPAKAKLPCIVYDEPTRGDVPYVASGYMGNTGALHLDPNCSEKPHNGASCLQVRFTATDWAGVVWQSPANDWGDKPGGVNLTGARKLTFWARGEKGGEKVDFKIGLIGVEKKYHDTANAELKTTLTNRWVQYSLDLAGKDLSRVKTGFVFVTAGSPTTFFLDDIVYK